MRIRERFNPHAPFEARRGGRLAPASNDRFNPRAPCGARLSCRIFPDNPKNFNPRAPCGARPSLDAHPLCVLDFNPRAPCGARQVRRLRNRIEYVFQPTRPLRGATRHGAGVPRVGGISTHAPLAGRDCRSSTPLTSCCHFNPRAPCGARPASRPFCGREWPFQPTRPLRGATIRSSTLTAQKKFQPTRPLRGATGCAGSSGCSVQRNFNPRAPCGARRAVWGGDRRVKEFQPTRPLRGATPFAGSPSA